MSTTELSDAEFLRALETVTYPGGKFGHRGHLRLGWLCLRAHGFEAGLARIRSMIQHFATGLGAREKYHETMTRAWALAVQAALDETPELDTFEAFLAAHPELQNPALLDRHYRKETLASPGAKQGWVPPDLEPLSQPRQAVH